MRDAHQDLLLLGIFVFIDIAASALLVRRLQDCLSAILQAVGRAW